MDTFHFVDCYLDLKFQVPYGYPPVNGRDRDYGRERREDYGRSEHR